MRARLHVSYASVTRTRARACEQLTDASRTATKNARDQERAHTLTHGYLNASYCQPRTRGRVHAPSKKSGVRAIWRAFRCTESLVASRVARRMLCSVLCSQKAFFPSILTPMCISSILPNTPSSLSLPLPLPPSPTPSPPRSHTEHQHPSAVPAERQAPFLISRGEHVPLIEESIPEHACSLR